MIRISNNLLSLQIKLAETREASKEKSLHDWFARKGESGSRGGWVDCNSPDGNGGYKACGRSEGESRKKYPACRPTPGACKEKGKGDSWGKKSEEDKKEDACTRKVKARYDVWPSAYASGALTKCRQVGADNWGNKKKESAFVHPDDPLANAARFGILGAAAGGLLGGGLPEELENPRYGITKGEWNSAGSAAGSVLGFLLGGAGGYMATPKSDKKKTKKKASSLASESILDVPIRCTPGFGCKRYFTPAEQVEVDAAKAQMFPMLFPTEADPISSQLSSPAWAGLGTGLMGALLGAGGGAGVGALLEKSAPVGALIGGAAGGLGGLLYGYGSRARKNKEIEDLMEDLPVGADLGDVELFSDPRLKAQLARDFQRQLVRKGLMG